MFKQYYKGIKNIIKITVVRKKIKNFFKLLNCFICASIKTDMVIKSRRLRWAGHVARMEEGRSVFKIVTDKPTGKRPLGRSRRRWEDNIRIDLEEIGINAGNWIDSAQDRDYWRALVNATLNLRVP